MSTRTYASRAKTHPTPLGRKLLSIIAAKKTNLSLSADVTEPDALLKLANICGPHICILKTHIDILTSFSQDFIVSLTTLATKHNFLIFEDRKFADIGSTVQHQYRDGIYHISSWAHIVNCHSVSGDGIVAGLHSAITNLSQTEQDERGLLILAQMSSSNNLFTAEYTQSSLDIARRNKSWVMGFIAMGRLPGMKEDEEEDFLVMTPGVNIETKGDGLGQQYQTPDFVVGEKGSDVIIVGRGIFGAGDKVEEVCIEYKTQGWKAYEDRIARQ